MIGLLLALALAADPQAGGAESSPPPAPPLITKAEWVSRPSAADMARVYPRVAMRKQISGQARLVCRLKADGRLTDCEATEETPAGMGFGEASLKLAAFFRMAPSDSAGPSLEGGTVMIPLVWNPPL